MTATEGTVATIPPSAAGRRQSDPGHAAAAGGQPLVSILTPAYNEQEYLRECIESVLAQTYQNWEYTIVNNQSTDATLAIAEEYAARDRRVRVHTTPAFLPVIANHNHALRQMSPAAKYCKIVFGDDLIYPHCLERLVEVAEAHPSVAIVGAYRILGDKVEAAGLPYPRTVSSGRELCRDFLAGGPYIFAAASSLLFRADVVRSRPAFFNEPHLNADTQACLEVLEDRDFGFVHEVLVFARLRESISSPVRQLNRYLPDKLSLVEKYGPRYFDKAELDASISHHLRQYYSYLGTQFGRGRGPEFWKFHREQLAATGRRLSTGRVLANAVVYLAEAALRRIRRAL
jgi:glycosyltransferase involved in cell wall biosynthesis